MEISSSDVHEICLSPDFGMQVSYQRVFICRPAEASWTSGRSASRKDNARRPTFPGCAEPRLLTREEPGDSSRTRLLLKKCRTFDPTERFFFSEFVADNLLAKKERWEREVETMKIRAESLWNSRKSGNIPWDLAPKLQNICFKDQRSRIISSSKKIMETVREYGSPFFFRHNART